MTASIKLMRAAGLEPGSSFIYLSYNKAFFIFAKNPMIIDNQIADFIYY